MERSLPLTSPWLVFVQCGCLNECHPGRVLYKQVVGTNPSHRARGAGSRHSHRWVPVGDMGYGQSGQGQRQGQVYV